MYLYFNHLALPGIYRKPYSATQHACFLV